MKFTQIYDGEWEYPRRRGYSLACCDCGLVHKMDFRVRNTRIEFRVFRDNIETDRLRRSERFKMTRRRGRD